MANFDFFNPISAEMELLEQELGKSLDSRIELLNESAVHLIKAGGKRLRPAFALLAAHIYREDLAEVIPLAVGLELVHMASLVHDDVIDNSLMRRGTETVKSAWGNRVSIYAGSFILARALSLIATYERTDIVDILAEASMKICEGEITQMLGAYNVELGLRNYLRRIERKTALLISVSCQLGAMLTNAPQREIRALQNYGYYLGMAFQVTDDILDIIADEQVLGKPTGSDIKQGVITLPAIYALRHSSRREELAALLSSPEACRSETARILTIILDTEGIDYSHYITQHFASKAQKQLGLLPASLVRENLYNIADFLSAREF